MTKKRENPIEGFSERLLQATYDSGLTHSEICRRAKIDRSSLYYYTTGHMPISSKLARIALVLNVSTDYLLGLSNVKELRK